MWQILVLVGVRQYEAFFTCDSYPEAVKIFNDTIHKRPDDSFKLHFNDALMEIKHENE